MREVTTALAAVGAAACWYFVVVYWWVTAGDWMRNPLGRHMLQFTGNLGALFTIIVAARMFGDYPGREPITLVLFAALVLQVVWRCVLLHKAQHLSR